MSRISALILKVGVPQPFLFLESVELCGGEERDINRAEEKGFSASFSFARRRWCSAAAAAVRWEWCWK